MSEYTIGIVPPSPLPESFFREYNSKVREYDSHIEIDIAAKEVYFDEEGNRVIVRLLFSTLDGNNSIALSMNKVLFVDDFKGESLFENPLFCKECQKNSGCIIKELSKNEGYFLKIKDTFVKVKCQECGIDWVFMPYEDE